MRVVLVSGGDVWLLGPVSVAAAGCGYPRELFTDSRLDRSVPSRRVGRYVVI